MSFCSLNALWDFFEDMFVCFFNSLATGRLRKSITVGAGGGMGRGEERGRGGEGGGGYKRTRSGQ